MESNNTDDRDLIAGDHSVACGRCGKHADSSEIELDEEEGVLLCPVCLAESISCGCSDE